MKKIKNSEIIIKTKSAYEKQISNHGFSPRGVFWQSDNTQVSRFETLIKAIKLSDQSGKISISDFGCGYGALYQYINKKPFMNGSLYIGYDIVDSFITEAKQRFPHTEWVCSEKILKKTDYIFISGTFNMAFDKSIPEWENYLENQLRECYANTNKVLAFNLLYSEKTKIEQNLYYSEIEKVFKFCDENLGSTLITKTPGANKDITIFVTK